MDSCCLGVLEMIEGIVQSCRSDSNIVDWDSVIRLYNERTGRRLIRWRHED